MGEVNLEIKATAIGKLFLGLGQPSSPERIAVYLEAVDRRSAEAVVRAVDQMLKTWPRERGFPYPGDVASASRVQDERLALPARLESWRTPEEVRARRLIADGRAAEAERILPKGVLQRLVAKLSMP